MPLTYEERKEVDRIEARLRELKARRDADAKARAKVARKARSKAIDRSRPEQRKERQRDNGYLSWLRRLPCVCCGSRQRVEAAHVRAGYAAAGWSPTGMMQKPDDQRAVPLAADCHREGPHAQHRTNERAWWAELGIDPPDLCADLIAAYEAGEDGLAVVIRFGFPRKERT